MLVFTSHIDTDIMNLLISQTKMYSDGKQHAQLCLLPLQMVKLQGFKMKIVCLQSDQGAGLRLLYVCCDAVHQGQRGLVLFTS